MYATTGVTSAGQSTVGVRGHGYAMAALLVWLSVMCVMVSVALPVWTTAIRREREAELIFRGQQYVRAIVLFQRKYAGTFPPSIDALLQERFLRRRYRDPITNDDFQLLYAGVPSGRTWARGFALPSAAVGRRGIQGVVSRSRKPPLRLYQGRRHYHEWTFVVTPTGTEASSSALPAEPTEEGNGVGRAQ